MYRLPSIILFLTVILPSLAQSPHGDGLKIDCAQCHNSAGWNIEVEYIKFDHSTTKFDLEGTHVKTDCILCHSTLVFDEAPTDCFSCHTDVHSMSVGTDCVRCHTSQTWLVDNISEIHEENGFPLIGTHNGLSCVECHLSETNLRFDNVGNDCISCHRDDYLAVQSPDHTGFSTNCLDCHNPLGIGWDTDVIAHDFFPLTLGHDIQDCNLCHTNGNFSGADPDCISCHQDDYAQTINPNHQAADFQTDCISCHTTNPGWMPATFDHDALFFPIYSGEHEGEWNACIDCHTDPNNYSVFTCTTCHMNSETDENHIGVSGYVYESSACFECHPAGNALDNFDHNLNTNFILDGAHDGLSCTECHVVGATSPPSTDCFACHNNDYLTSTNPNHSALALPTDCVSCHTTDPDWMPATFANHDDYYQLNGAHAMIANNCATCHNGDYNNTPDTCVGCHQDDYNSTTNPNHVAAQFPTDCAVCHTETVWTPATYNHDATAFPLTGAHIGLDCLECHAGGYTGTPTDCFACHQTDYNSTTDPDHSGSGFPTDCVICHTTNPGWTPASFNHNDTAFPLTGAHIGLDCLECHAGGYAGTPTDCFACHATDYNTSTNPNHASAQFPTDCASCHTTNPGWTPSTFDHDGQYFKIYSGHHDNEWNLCSECHTNPSNYMIFTCITCHDQSSTNQQHDPNEVPNYIYESNACYACHPDA